MSSAVATGSSGRVSSISGLRTVLMKDISGMENLGECAVFLGARFVFRGGRVFSQESSGDDAISNCSHIASDSASCAAISMIGITASQRVTGACQHAGEPSRRISVLGVQAI